MKTGDIVQVTSGNQDNDEQGMYRHYYIGDIGVVSNAETLGILRVNFLEINKITGYRRHNYKVNEAEVTVIQKGECNV